MPGRYDVGQGRLFDRQEWPHLIAAGADDADRAGKEQEQEVPGTGECRVLSASLRNRIEPVY